MNKIWLIVCLIACAVLGFINPESLLPTLIGSTNSALKLSFELLAIYSVWLGILGIVENTKLSSFLAKLLSPLIDWLWGKKDMNKDAKKYLSLSLSTSLLGIGGASVPFGIKAIEKMDNKTGVVTFPMIMTIIFASSGVQILPTTVMGLMVASGSNNASFIILPTILAGLCTTIVGVVLAKILEKITQRKKKEN